MTRQRLHTYGRANHCVLINNELREADAYKALTPSARLVLIDWVARYNSKSKCDTISIKGAGFSYAFSDCLESVNESTFKAARQAILAKGFFECPEGMQTLKPGSRRIYTPSTKWRTYAPTPAEAKAIATANTSKKKALQRWNRFNDRQNQKKGGGNGQT